MSVSPSRAVLPRKTISEKKAFVEQWTVSNTRLEDFCISHQISLSAFKYWSRQFGAPPKKRTGSKAFLPIKIFRDKQHNTITQGIFVGIILLNGNRILFHQPVDPSVLKEIIA